MKWKKNHPIWGNHFQTVETRSVDAAGSNVVFELLTSIPLHGFQRSTAAALCDLTTEVLRTINATENAMVEYGLSEPVDRSHLVGTDVKQADDAFRELEENVSFITSLCLKVKLSRTPPPRLKHDRNVWTGFKHPSCCVSSLLKTGLGICKNILNITGSV